MRENYQPKEREKKIKLKKTKQDKQLKQSMYDSILKYIINLIFLHVIAF